VDIKLCLCSNIHNIPNSDWSSNLFKETSNTSWIYCNWRHLIFYWMQS